MQPSYGALTVIVIDEMRVYICKRRTIYRNCVLCKVNTSGYTRKREIGRKEGGSERWREKTAFQTAGH